MNDNLNALVVTRKMFPEQEFWDALDVYREGKGNGYYPIWVDWVNDQEDESDDNWAYVIGKLLKEKGYTDDITILVDNTW